jgi:hypothetical protein
MRSGVSVALGLLLLATLGCSSSTIEPEPGDGSGDETPSDVLELTVGPDSRTFVELSKPALVELSGNGDDSIAWDIALSGRKVFTNGGVSGPGNCSAFGPLPAPTFLSDSAPDTPLLLKDHAGGALLDWYDYGGDTHLLYSRYHVYGLRDGERLYKLQILSYYADQLGAPVSAHYHVRYAEVPSDGSAGETHEIDEIDASAGGSKDDDSQPSACLELENERVSMLTPDQASQSEAWHVCFRREAIAINGGISGPRGVAAVDLQAASTADETEKEIQARTADSELGLFDGVDLAALGDDSLRWREDGVATAFADRWLEPDSDPLTLSDTVWFVIAADGAGKYLLKFQDLSGDPAIEQATLGLRAKSVR